MPSASSPSLSSELRPGVAPGSKSLGSLTRVPGSTRNCVTKSWMVSLSSLGMRDPLG